MYLITLLIASIAVITIFPGTLAAPGLHTHPSVDKRWFTLNPSPDSGGSSTWPGHVLKYKFKNDDSKTKLGAVVTAGWKLWTDNGVDKANIDIIESTDNDALVIEVTSAAKAQTSVGYQGAAHMTFGDSTSYGLLDKNANMAHELGHALGFYHEHQRDDRNDHVVFNCENLADYTEDRKKDGFCDNMIAAKNNGWSSLDFIILPQSFSNPALNCYGVTYDEDSIMHYPGGAGAAKPLIGHRRTVLGTKADPNTSFKKNMKPSSTDTTRVNVMYATQGNQKRDVGKDCRSQARLSRTYTVPAALTSALQVTDAPIDITGTPIISAGPTDGPSESSVTPAPYPQGSIGPLTSCSLVQTTITGTIAGGPQTYCTCGDVMAGINTQSSGNLVYSVCAGDPYPTIATSTITPAPVTTPPPTTTTPLDPKSVCVHVFTNPPEHTASCTSSISKSDLSTPLPDGAWTCLQMGIGGVCYCQAEGDSQPCQTLDDIQKGN